MSDADSAVLHISGYPSKLERELTVIANSTTVVKGLARPDMSRSMWSTTTAHRQLVAARHPLRGAPPAHPAAAGHRGCAWPRPPVVVVRRRATSCRARRLSACTATTKCIRCRTYQPLLRIALIALRFHRRQRRHPRCLAHRWPERPSPPYPEGVFGRDHRATR